MLHFDVNETILLGDAAGGDTFDESLNKIICKSAFVRRTERSEPDGNRAEDPLSDWQWHDGQTLRVDAPAGTEAVDPPPLVTSWEWPPSTRPFYRVPALKERYAKRFTEPGSPGRIYRPFYEELCAALRVSSPGIDSRLCHDGVHHFVMPAFFQTLQRLTAAGRRFTLVIRTFGSDTLDVAAALNAWAEGRHAIPGHPDLRFEPSRAWTGRYDSEGHFRLVQAPQPPVSSLQGSAAEVGQAPGAGAGSDTGRELQEEDAVEFLESGIPVASIHDDYEWWRQHGYAPAAGKPLWLTIEDQDRQHIFFDDNIHNDAADSIVAVRARERPGVPFSPLSGETTRQLQDTFLVRVPTIDPILNPDWFLERIAICEASFRSRRWVALMEETAGR